MEVKPGQFRLVGLFLCARDAYRPCFCRRLSRVLYLGYREFLHREIRATAKHKEGQQRLLGLAREKG